MSLPESPDDTFRLRYPALWKRSQTRKAKREKPAKKKQKSLPTRNGTLWSAEDKRTLLGLWGEKSLRIIARELERSEGAVSSMAKELGIGPASASNGAMSLRQFAKYSGFSRLKITNAAQVLGVRLHRAKTSAPVTRKTTGRIHQKSRTTSISLSQQAELLEYLLSVGEKNVLVKRKKKDSWEGRDPERCVACRRSDVAHEAKGMCAGCYSAYAKRRARAKVRDRERVQEGVERRRRVRQTDWS